MEDLSLRIRSLRTEAGKSQRSLAREAGVSNGTISLIESGKTDPTVGQLKKILSALNMSMAEFFETGSKPKDQYFFSKDDLVEIGSGKISYRHISNTNR